MNEYEVQTNTRKIVLLAHSETDAFDRGTKRLGQGEHITGIRGLRRGVVEYDLTQGMCQS